VIKLWLITNKKPMTREVGRVADKGLVEQEVRDRDFEAGTSKDDKGLGKLTFETWRQDVA